MKLIAALLSLAVALVSHLPEASAETSEFSDLGSRIREFTQERLTIGDCGFDADFVEAALVYGLNNVNAVNPALVLAIQETALSGDTLAVKCDVQDGSPAIYFDPATSTIHLWAKSRATDRTGANFFHEFLHFANMYYVRGVHMMPGLTRVWDDPVYSCHYTGMPFLFDPSDLTDGSRERILDRCSRAFLKKSR